MSGFAPSSTQRALTDCGRMDARIRATFRTSTERSADEWRSRLERVAERHEILRTRLVVPPGLKLPVQEIGDTCRVDVEVDGDRLTLDAPAACLDARSMVLLARELEQESNDEPMQFADASEWLDELLEEAEGAEARAFWKQRHDTIGSMARGFGSTDSDPYAHDLVDGGAAHVLAILRILSTRIDERHPPSLGLMLDGRIHEDLEAALGPFARCAPIALGPALDQPFRVHATWAQRELDELIALQAQLTRPGDAPEPPLVLRLDDVRDLPEGWTLDHVDDGALGSAIVLALARTRDGWTLRAEGTAEGRRLVEQVVCASNDAREHPERAAASLDAVPAAHREQLATWSPTPESPAPQRMDQVFADAAQRAPDAPVVLGSAHSSYADALARASSITAALRERGVKRGQRVALAISDRRQLVPCIVGIWRAGAAYVPIDPAYPDDRVRFLLDDSRSTCVLTDDTRFDDAVRLDRIPDAATETSAEGDVDDVAYVIYTSGSTGRPKGVEVTHRQLHASTSSRLAHYGGGPEVFLLLSSFAFDSSVAGIFWTLSTGGALVLPAEGEERDPERLAKRIERHSVRTLLTLPSLYMMLLDHAEQLGSLRTAIVAGEACATNVVERHMAALPKCALHNEYGPTEATVWSTVWRADRVPSRVPIGGPVRHAQLFVVDPRAELSPIGAAGELWIGGHGVAKGYLDRPELTDERFVDSPFGRVYRSGDRVRWNEGELEFLGRVDDQVKVRGFRIELGEIESVLAALPGVREAAAAVRGEAESARLVGYLVCDEPLDTEALRASLSTRLPAYMVPGLVRVDDLPRTPNGKVDRDRLPHPDSLGRSTSTEYVAPRDPVEEVVCGIWGQVLGVEQVGVLDDFFELGGTSLVVTQTIARIRQAFRIDVPLRTLFDHPQVGALVKTLRETHGERMEKLAPLLLELARADAKKAAELVASHRREE